MVQCSHRAARHLAGFGSDWGRLPTPLLVLALALTAACRPPTGGDGGPPLAAEAPHVVESPTGGDGPPPAQPPTQPPAKARALLVGINDYLYDDDISDLRGTINDVNAMQDLLVRRFGFEPASIVVLRDKEATKANIERAFRTHLIEPATTDSVVALYVSSHGSEKWDESGDEPKHYDQTIVTHDSGRSDGRENRDITDDELNGLLRELNQKTKHVTVIFDSCHSGTAMRATARPRAAKPDCRGCRGEACAKCGEVAASRSAAPAGAAASAGAAHARGYVGFEPGESSYVLISGAASDEYSYERVIEGRPMGALTWFLTRALWQAKPGTTYRDVMAQVAADVTSSLPAQHPQIEGRAMDTEVFGMKSLPPEPFLEVRSTGSVPELLGGSIHGVSVGSRYDVFPPGTKDFAQAAAIGKLEVSAVEGVTAKVVQLEGAKPLPVGARAIETYHQFDRTSLRLRVEAATKSQRLSSVVQALSDDGQIALVGADADYDILLRENGGQIEVERSTEKDGAELTATRIPDDDRAIDKAVDLVRRWARWHATRLLASLPATSDVTFTADASGKSLDAGTVVKFSLSNDSRHRYYLSLLALSSDGSISLVYPEPGASEYLEPGGKWSKSLQTCVPKGKRSVRDVAKVFLTEEPHHLAFLEQGALEKSVAKGETSSLESVLATRGLGVTRGLIRPTQGVANTWQTRSVAYEVRSVPGAVTCPD
jgi:caspase domain-containing protein